MSVAAIRRPSKPSFTGGRSTPASYPLYWYAAYYSLLALATILGVVYGLYFSEMFFADGPNSSLLLRLLKLFWLIPVPYALLNFYSFLRYPVFVRSAHPTPHPQAQGRLIIRYVSRGHNKVLLAEVVAQARATLAAEMPFDGWRVEAIVDCEQIIPEDHFVRVIVVPSDYQTKRGARYKARALQYALENSEATPQDWIIHLDEETRFNRDTVRAIAAFARREEQLCQANPKHLPRIGQGIIRYNRGGIVNLLTTLADSIRVGDDYGRFRLQFEQGHAWFGMHGSFVVIRNAIELMVSFDHGPAANITEDAYFALVAHRCGVRFGFINAFMDEQSPYTLADFARQRRRWFGGLWLCVLSPDISRSDRLILGTFMIMWSVAPICIGLVYWNILFPTGTPPWLAVMGGVSFAYYVTLYVVGFVRNFDLSQNRLYWLRLFFFQILLIPFFSVMEASGVIYGLLSPPREFYIVRKER